MTHLTDAQLKQQKQLLNDEVVRLRNEIRDHLLEADKAQYADLAGQVHDLADESVADLLGDVNVTVMGHLISELRETEAALQRISTGSYGLCEDCGKDIPYSRLQAYPTARRCIADQERHEKFYAEKNKPSI